RGEKGVQHTLTTGSAQAGSALDIRRMRYGSRVLEGGLRPEFGGWAGSCATTCRGSQSGALGLVPQPVQLLQTDLGKRPALVAQPALDMAQTPLELLIAAAQGCFGVDLQMAGQIDHRKQQITHL